LIKKSIFYSSFILLTLAGITLLYINFQSFWLVPKYQVSIAVSKTPLSTPFYVAQAINAFDNTCVTVQFDEVIGGQAAFTKVMNGDVDFGTSSDSVIAFQSLAQKTFVTHTMFVQSDNDVKLITRPTDNISSIIDLKGKRIGVTKGTASEYFLSILLALEGLTVEDITISHHKPDQLVDSFINNKVDAITPWEPFVFQSQMLLNQRIKIHDTKNLNTLSFNLISQMADDLLVEKAKCIIQGLAIATDYIASNPNKSKRIVIDKLNVSPEFIDWVWPDYVFKLALNQSLVLSIKSQAEWAVATQMSEFNKLPNVNHFIDNRAMLQVDHAAVNIHL
jgi:ABC-type nitrate/sulfonate/bicarbonate transport system substrate-binding protein